MKLKCQHTVGQSVSKRTVSFDVLGNVLANNLVYMEFLTFCCWNHFPWFLSYMSVVPNCMNAEKDQRKLHWSTVAKREGENVVRFSGKRFELQGLCTIWLETNPWNKQPCCFLDVKHSCWKRERAEVTSRISQQTPSVWRSTSHLVQLHKFFRFPCPPQSIWRGEFMIHSFQAFWQPVDCRHGN